MQEHQVRVVKELQELESKATGLGAFIGSASFKKVSVDEKRRLSDQLYIMDLYIDILNQRIDNLFE